MNTKNQKEIQEVLNSFGLTQKEQTIYCALLQHGEQTLTPLSKIVKLQPTTLQSILYRLIEKDILYTSKRKSKNIYHAHPPKKFQTIIETQLKEIKNIIPLLKKLENSENHASPKVHVYSKKNTHEVLNKILNCKKKLIREIISAHDFQKLIGEKYHFTKKRCEKNIYLESLRIQSHEIKKYSKKIHSKELREAKFLPKELTFQSSIMIWDNSLAIFSSNKEGMIMIIESESISTMAYEIFELLWSVSRKMETL